MNKHKIQNEILVKLLTSENGLRYRDMKDSSVENDLYNYHLQYLVKEELIIKLNDCYFLTEKGKHYIEEAQPIDPLGNISELFRVNVLCGVVRNINGKLEILNQLRKRQPYYGDKGIIGGAVKKGESIVEAANRKLKDETGLNGNFKTIGLIRKLRYKPDGDLFTDIFFHICFTDEFNGELLVNSSFGEHFWLDLEDSIEAERNSVMGSLELVKFLEKLRDYSFTEIPYFYVEEKKILSSL